MSSQADVQMFLRFLSQDAKVPLAMALGKVKLFHSKDLSSAAAIASAKPGQIREIFDSEGDAADKLAKQVHNAAKRVTKRKAGAAAADGDGGDEHKPPKKRKRDDSDLSPVQKEAALALPAPSDDVDKIRDTVLVTNRAPLVLAFAVTLLKYTMPEQPLSSRLSLAQALVSLNSKSRAISLGIESGKTAEDEGWGKGQPGVRIMGREVKVMKRWGYDPTSEGDESAESTAEGEQANDDDTALQKPPMWGLDLESLKKGGEPGSRRNLPIHTPESARAYLLKSFASPARKGHDSSASGSPPKASERKRIVAEKEQNLGLLLGSLDLLYASWNHLSAQELDQRAWSWYVKVRPDVDHGPSGWGGKGEVALGDVLDLCKSGCYQPTTQKQSAGGGDLRDTDKER